MGSADLGEKLEELIEDLPKSALHTCLYHLLAMMEDRDVVDEAVDFIMKR